MTTKNLRNIAIIAHVDHGKTTLVDAFLKQSKTFRVDQAEMSQTTIMDNNDQERERGITILAKNTSVFHEKNGEHYKINIVDTPGHSDFSGEVERVLNMVDGAILVVDAQEGTMPQTKFVLKQALGMNLKIIVLINKIDKQFADIEKSISRVQDLFLEVCKSEDQLNFPVMYAIGRDGKSWDHVVTRDADGNFPEATILPLLDKVIDYIPSPVDNTDKPLQMLVSNLDYDKHLGNLVIGKITSGVVNDGMNAAVIDPNGKIGQFKITKLYVTEGLAKLPVKSAICGDIAMLSGALDVAIGSTISDSTNPVALPTIRISEPSLKVKIEANTSPFAGRVGDFLTARQILERLEREMLTNVAMKLDVIGESEFVVSGRGELHISILLEKLRREGYEFQVSKPQAILKKIDGVVCEPQETLVIDMLPEYVGAVNSEILQREGSLVSMENDGTYSRVTYSITTRKLLGLRGVVLSITKGTALINSAFSEYVPYQKNQKQQRKGVIISMDTGSAFDYAIEKVQERGRLFIKGQDEIYEGMIIGINKFENDLEVNPCVEKHKTGHRVSIVMVATPIVPPIPVTLEFALTFIEDDELIEVTPNEIRLRKKYLTKKAREISSRGTLSENDRKYLEGTL